MALRKLKSTVFDLPKKLVETKKKNGYILKDYRTVVKETVFQIVEIRKAVKFEKAGKLTKSEKDLRKDLGALIDWMQDTFLENFSPSNEETGLVDTLRTELNEDQAKKIFGGKGVRLLRSKLKSFQNGNKTMKNMSASTLFNWSSQKKSFGKGGDGKKSRDYDRNYDRNKHSNRRR